MTYRAVVIGCGTIGSAASTTRDGRIRSHAQAYTLHASTELVGLADTDDSRRRAAHDLWGVVAVSDGVELCRQAQPDIVSICTPDATHAEIALSVLEVSRPGVLLIEKPLALSAAHARTVVAAAEQRGTSVAVAHTRRFSPAFRAVAADLRSGAYGRARLLRILYGKGLFHNGIHAIDLVRFWLGDPIGCRGREVMRGPEGDPTFDAELWFANGARALLEAFDERVATVFEGDLFTDRARVHFTSGGETWGFSDLAESALHPGYRMYQKRDPALMDAAFRHPLDDWLLRAVDDLVSHLEKRTPLMSPGADGIAALEWLERLRGR